MNDKGGAKTLFVFAGTTEGRLLIEGLLQRGVEDISAFTATEYGGGLLCSLDCKIRAGRLDAEAMQREIEQGRPDCVIDATHPYAVLVRGNIKAACQKTGVRYLRLKRELGAYDAPSAIRVKTAAEAADFLKDKAGNIFLAIGAKEAAPFACEALRERVFIRILALEESVSRCRALGFAAKNIIAMQGPFSEELNSVLFRESGAAWLVSKVSGEAGGFEEKLSAARSCNMTAILIEPPEDAASEEESKNIEEICTILGLECADTSGNSEFGRIFACSEAGENRAIRSNLSAARPNSAAIPCALQNAACRPTRREGAPSDYSAGRKAAVPPAAIPCALQNGGVPPQKTIVLVSCGTGSADFLTEAALQAIEKSDCVIAAQSILGRHTKIIEKKPQKAFFRAEEIVDFIEKSDFCNFAVLLSGDGGFFSLAKTLLPVLEERSLSASIIPGISSISLLAARLALSWEEAKTISLHGRAKNAANLIIGAVSHNKKAFFLTDGNAAPDFICKTLAENGLGSVIVSIGEELSLPTERILRGRADAFTETAFSALNVLFVENPEPLPPELSHYGLEDGFFERGKVPMTKAEVRSVSLSRLRIEPEDTVWDIGAGTGAFCCAAALCAKYGRVYAVEREAEALELIRRNREKLGLHNIEIIAGSAPDALNDLPPPDAVFIGGSGGQLPALVDIIFKKNPLCRIVITALTLETIGLASEITRRPNIKNIDITQIAVSRAHKAGSYRMMKAENPIFVFSFSGGALGSGGDGAI